MLREFFHCLQCKNFCNCTRRFRPYNDEPDFTHIEIEDSSLIAENPNKCKKPMKISQKK